LNWQGHSAEELKAMKDGLERLKNLGVEAIEDKDWSTRNHSHLGLDSLNTKVLKSLETILLL